MEVKHTGHKGTSLDPTLDALEILPDLVGEATRESPSTPEALWKVLQSRGFYFMYTTRDGRLARLPEAAPELPEWGRLYASLLLAHGAAGHAVEGDLAAERYWPKRA